MDTVSTPQEARYLESVLFPARSARAVLARPAFHHVSLARPPPSRMQVVTRLGGSALLLFLEVCETGAFAAVDKFTSMSVARALAGGLYDKLAPLSSMTDAERVDYRSEVARRGSRGKARPGTQCRDDLALAHGHGRGLWLYRRRRRMQLVERLLAEKQALAKEEIRRHDMRLQVLCARRVGRGGCGRAAVRRLLAAAEWCGSCVGATCPLSWVASIP